MMSPHHLKVPSDPLNLHPKSNPAVTHQASGPLLVNKKESEHHHHKSVEKSKRKPKTSRTSGYVIPKIKIAGNEKYMIYSQADPSLLEFAKVKVSKSMVKEDFAGSISQMTSPSTMFSENVNRIPSYKNYQIRDKPGKLDKRTTPIGQTTGQNPEHNNNDHHSEHSGHHSLSHPSKKSKAKKKDDSLDLIKRNHSGSSNLKIIIKKTKSDDNLRKKKHSSKTGDCSKGKSLENLNRKKPSSKSRQHLGNSKNKKGSLKKK